MDGVDCGVTDGKSGGGHYSLWIIRGRRVAVSSGSSRSRLATRNSGCVIYGLVMDRELNSPTNGPVFYILIHLNGWMETIPD